MLTLYSLITWTGMLLFGPATWLARGEAFTLIATGLGRFSPTELRVSDPQLCVRAGCPIDDSGCADCAGAFYAAPPSARVVNMRPYGAGLVISRPLAVSMMVVVLMIRS